MNKKQAYFILCIAPILLFSQELLTGKAIFWGLPALQFYPWRELAFDQILSGFLPLWNPYNGLGTPLLANYQSALFYPATWILFLFYLLGKLPAMIWGHMLLNVAHLIFAAMGIYQVCEEKKLSVIGGTIAGLIFSLGGYLITRFGFYSMIWTAAWFPWVYLYTMQISGRKSSSRHVIRLAVMMAGMLLAGHAQVSWYILLFCFLWIVIHFSEPYTEWAKSILRYFIAGFLSVCLSAIQLIPTAALLFSSQRSSEVDYATAMIYSFWPWHFLNFINPNIFGQPISGSYWGYGAYWEDAVYFGLLPLFLVLGSIVIIFRKKNWQKDEKRDYLFFWLISLLAVLLSLGNNSAVYPWLYEHIPTFEMFNSPARFMIWLVFSCSLLAAFAFDHWKKPEKKVLYWVRLGTAGGFGIGIGAYLMLMSKSTIQPTFILATFQISVLTFISGVLYLLNPNQEGEVPSRNKLQFWQTGVIFFILGDLIFMNINTTPVENILEFTQFQQQTVQTTERIYIREKDDYDIRYNHLLNFSDFSNTLSIEELFNAEISNVNILQRWISLNNFEPMRLGNYDEFITELNQLTDKDQLKYYKALGIGVLFKINPETRTKVDQIEIADLGEIQFFTNYDNANSMQAYFEKSRSSDCLFLMEDTTREFDMDIPCQSVEVSIYKLIWLGNKISFEVNVPEDGWLLINDTYDRGWKATIDQKTENIFQANGFVKAVPITKGNHEVKLIYLPDYFIVGGIISLVSMILMSILYYKDGRRNRIQE